LYPVREIWFVSSSHLCQGILCVHAMTSIAHCFSVLSIGVNTMLSESRVFVSLAHGPRWLFLLSRHRKAISAAANQKPFVNKDLCTRKSMKRTVKW